MAKAAWEKDAEDFGRRFRFGEWESGLLVARSVYPGPGDVATIRSAARQSGKAIPADFAEIAQVGLRTVQRHLKTWKFAAKEGLVPSADELLPGGAMIDLPEADLWKRYYQKANPDQRTKTVSREQDADVAAMAALAEISQAMDEVVEMFGYAKLSAEQRAGAEVLCRGVDEGIAAIREITQPDDLDAEHIALLEAEGAS